MLVFREKNRVMFYSGCRFSQDAGFSQDASISQDAGFIVV